MKVLGLRCSKKEIRYAIIEKTNDEFIFVNRDEETKLKFPATITLIEDKVLWFSEELKRILRQNSDLSSIVIKVNEFAGNENWAKREGAYLDAVAILTAKNTNKDIYKKIYSQIGTKGSDVKERAESLVGRTNKYWDSKIADAIVSAASILQG